MRAYRGFPPDEAPSMMRVEPMRSPNQIIATLNSLHVGEMEMIGTKLDQARQACLELEIFKINTGAEFHGELGPEKIPC